MSSFLPPGSRVVIVDSSAILKSCFEGYKDTRTSQFNGRPVDVMALYGYVYRTKKLYETFDFEAIVHVMDPPGGSHFRYGIYPAYKANRSEDDDPALAAQKALLSNVLSAFGEPYLRVRGMESDDVIGTLAKRLSDAGHEVLIVSPDKDLMQLVRDGCISVARYVNAPSGVGKAYTLYEESDVLKSMGVRPDQVADFLALVGDTADNIPGVFKVGEKTAAKWLAEYGDLASLMTRAHEIPGKVGEHFRAALPQLPLYRQLTGVLYDIPNLDLPPRPEMDDEAHYRCRELLLLKDDFPCRFGMHGLHTSPSPRPAVVPARAPATPEPAPAPRPTVSLGRPATLRPTAPPAAEAPAPEVAKASPLLAPDIDPLVQPAPALGRGDEVLGALFGGDEGFAAENPFVDLPEAAAFDFGAGVADTQMDPPRPTSGSTPPVFGRPTTRHGR